MNKRLFYMIMSLSLFLPSALLAASGALPAPVFITTGDPLGLSLVIAGLLLVIAEIVIISHGLLALSGTLFFIMGSVLVVQAASPAAKLLWLNTLSIGLFITAGISVMALYALSLYRKNASHHFALTGQKALVVTWNDDIKRVEIDGSFWNAQSLSGKQYTHGEWVVVEKQDNLTLYIQ